MHIQIETPDQPDVAALFAQLQALHAKRYPSAASTPLPLASMHGRGPGGALVLYERFGFTRCAPYGGNGAEPLEVCMEMRL